MKYVIVEASCIDSLDVSVSFTDAENVDEAYAYAEWHLNPKTGEYAPGEIQEDGTIDFGDEQYNQVCFAVPVEGDSSVSFTNG